MDHGREVYVSPRRPDVHERQRPFSSPAISASNGRYGKARPAVWERVHAPSKKVGGRHTTESAPSKDLNELDELGWYRPRPGSAVHGGDGVQARPQTAGGHGRGQAAAIAQPREGWAEGSGGGAGTEMRERTDGSGPGEEAMMIQRLQVKMYQLLKAMATERESRLVAQAEAAAAHKQLQEVYGKNMELDKRATEAEAQLQVLREASERERERADRAEASAGRVPILAEKYAEQGSLLDEARAEAEVLRAEKAKALARAREAVAEAAEAERRLREGVDRADGENLVAQRAKGESDARAARLEKEVVLMEGQVTVMRGELERLRHIQQREAERQRHLKRSTAGPSTKPWLAPSMAGGAEDVLSSDGLDGLTVS